jgi:ribosomal protein S20
MRKLIAALTAASVLMLGGAGVAGAQGDAGSEQGSPSADRPHHHPRRHGLRIAARAAAEALGMTVAELRESVRGGQTVTEVAESKGVNPDDVAQAIVGALTEAVDRAVSKGRITAERAATIKERLPTLAERFMSHEPKARPEAEETQTSV